MSDDANLIIDKQSLAELHRRLGKYTDSQGKAAMRKGCRWGAKIIMSAVKGNTPVETGALRRSLKVKAMKRSRSGVGVMAKFGDGWYQGETFYGAFIEFGHKIGKSGEVKGTHFMQNAAKGVRRAASRATIQRITFELDKLALKK